MTRRKDVRPHKAVRALGPLLCFAFAAATPWFAEARGPTVDVGACVDYDESDGGDTSMKVGLASRCSAALRCEVSWSLSCDEGAPAKADKRKFTLGAGAQHQVKIDASGCGEGLWEVSELSWSCVQR